jgi:hypothetical protein
MNTGQIISGVAHLGLIGWAVLGGMFSADEPALEVTEVTAISAEQFAALTARQSAPGAVAAVDTPEPPSEGAAPAVRSRSDAAVAKDQPPETVTPAPETAPERPETAPPAPAEVEDTPPEMAQPSEDVAVMVPERAEQAQPRAAPRVAPEPVARPDPDVQVDDVARPETQPDATAETPREEREASAPEEATTEIVTEAEEAAAAPARSARPRSRPAAPEPRATRQEPAVPETDESAVTDALAEAMGQADTDAAAAGPPLSRGEKDALRVAVEQCWNVGSLSSAALRTTVVVGVSMNKDGTPRRETIELLSATGGDDAAARQAFEAARRAIIRCGLRGYDLPPEKYERWRDIEMTFNPEKMRIK